MASSEIIGIIPAAGSATRLSHLPCSKEIFPVGFRKDKENRTVPKVAANFLIDYMKTGGASQILMVIKQGKWDIPAYFKDGQDFDVDMAYLMATIPYGVPFTINQAHGLVGDHLVLFGFPDIIIEPDHVFEKLRTAFEKEEVDVVLGLFPVDNVHKWDMVHLQEDGKVTGIDIKPEKTTLKYTWAVACWGRKFSDLVKEYCEKELSAINASGKTPGDYHLGHCLIFALEKNFKIKGVVFEDGKCIDVGTPEDLVVAKRNLLS